MTDFTDLLGELMPSEMTRSGNDRLRHAMGDQGLGGPGDLATWPALCSAAAVAADGEHSAVV
jgi:hypothetical protein